VTDRELRQRSRAKRDRQMAANTLCIYHTEYCIEKDRLIQYLIGNEVVAGINGRQGRTEHIRTTHRTVQRRDGTVGRRAKSGVVVARSRTPSSGSLRKVNSLNTTYFHERATRAGWIESRWLSLQIFEATIQRTSTTKHERRETRWALVNSSIG
jgi:hypothetical protein